MKIALAVAIAAAVIVAPAALGGATKLNGTVGPGFTITLSKAGKKVTALKAGTYTFVVSDKSSQHDFHLSGPGVNKSTSVGATGTQTWTLKLKKGTYTFQCDPHSSFMHGSFKVT